MHITLDEKEQSPVITYSRHGGMSIERQERLHPGDIYRLPVDYIKGVEFKELLKVGSQLGLNRCDSKLAFLIKNCYELFVQRDCHEVLINPLVWTKEGHFRAANPRIHIDDNSLYRQSEMLNMFDNAQVNNLERIASFHDLSFKKIHDEEANVGVITNGFGLSMASMDLIHNMHGKPACYMDLSIASSIEDVLYGLDLMEYDKRVKVVLINIFGGGADV